MDRMKLFPFLLTVLGVLSIGWMGPVESAKAEWAINMEGAWFYTDDVGLFSSSRRLSLQEDPTQPVIDVTDQGDDFVFEPVITVGKTLSTRLGKSRISFRGQGFVFVDHHLFSHGTYGVKLEQTLPSEIMLGLRYHFSPNLFLGNNEERRSGRKNLVEERVTTHFWAGTIEREIVDELRLRLLGRYGLRVYNENFAQRDTHFWTVGPHMEWVILPGMEFSVGYHFERGYADGRNQPQLKDDVSYINHYVSTELEVEVFENTTLDLAFHYERNDFTSDIEEDERKGAAEDVLQGDVELRHRLSKALELNAGFQRSQRKASFEPSTIIDVNVWLGGAYQF